MGGNSSLAADTLMMGQLPGCVWRKCPDADFKRNDPFWHKTDRKANKIRVAAWN